MKKNKDDLFDKKIVLFVTSAQKEKLLDYCYDNKATMSAWAREKIDRLPR